MLVQIPITPSVFLLVVVYIVAVTGSIPATYSGSWGAGPFPTAKLADDDLQKFWSV